jgi:hypothetical protein
MKRKYCDSERIASRRELARPRNRFWALGKRLMNLNPHSFRKIVSTLLEMNEWSRLLGD